MAWTSKAGGVSIKALLIGWLVRHPWFNNPSWYVFYRPTKWCCSWQWKRLIEYGGKLFEMAGLDWPTNPAGDTHFTAGSKISSSQSSSQSSSAIKPLLKSGQHFFILIFSAILLLESSGQIMGNKGSLHICMEPAEIRSRSHCLNQQNYFQCQLKLILVLPQKDRHRYTFYQSWKYLHEKGRWKKKLDSALDKLIDSTQGFTNQCLLSLDNGDWLSNVNNSTIF